MHFNSQDELRRYQQEEQKKQNEASEQWVKKIALYRLEHPEVSYSQADTLLREAAMADPNGELADIQRRYVGEPAPVVKQYGKLRDKYPNPDREIAKRAEAMMSKPDNKKTYSEATIAVIQADEELGEAYKHMND